LTRQRTHILIQEGRLKARKVGSEYKIKPGDLELFKSQPRKGGRPHKLWLDKETGNTV
jgi:hypothetical protein